MTPAAEPDRILPVARPSVSRTRGGRTRDGWSDHHVPSPGVAVRYLRRADPVLARVIDRHPDFEPRAWLTDFPPMDAFGVLVFQITGQQLSIRSAHSTLNQLRGRFHGRLPTPEELTALSPATLRRLGFSRAKIRTLREVAERFRDGRLSDRLLRGLSDAEIEECLTQIKGIGPWTVHGFLIIALDRPDVVPPGDLVLRKVVQRTYRLRALPTVQRVLKIAEAWRPYRSLATGYLFHAAFAPAN